VAACSSSDADVQPDARIDSGVIDSALPDARAPNVVDLAWNLPRCMTSKLPPRDPQGEFLKFCIPNQGSNLSEVRSILDPLREETGYLSQGGRIGCVERIAWAVINI